MRPILWIYALRGRPLCVVIQTPTPWHTPTWIPMGNPHNQIWTYLNAIWPIAIVLRHTLKYHTGLVFRIQWYYPTFFPHLQHSKFLTSSFLMFNPSRATYELLPSAGIRSYIPSFYFLKRVKSKFAMIHSWLDKKITDILRYRPFSSQCLIARIRKFRLTSFTTCFDYSSNFVSLTLSLNIFLPSNLLIVNRDDSWMTSLNTYRVPVSRLI